MVYVSTGGFSSWSFIQSVNYLASFGINAFELSGGLHVNEVNSALDNILERQYHLSLHNYFPPPSNPFVFNLASQQEEIVEKSMMHAKCSIDLASEKGLNYYSFHAGYLIDPEVSELGQVIKKRTFNDRDDSKELFVNRVNQLSLYAAEKKVKLLIENNVLSFKNYQEFNNNPLLMVDSDETFEIMRETDKNVGLLIDVAHLKVSSNTLGFSAEEYLLNFEKSTCGYHLSDNNGLEDSNSPVTECSWFWPLITKSLDYYVLEVYNQSGDILKKQVDLTSQCLS